MLNKFNLSYSSYSLFKTSPLQFYFQYLTKPAPTNKVMSVYGDAGNVVHKAIEDYINKNEDTFDAHWMHYKIDEQTGFKGAILSKQVYDSMYQTAVTFFNELKASKNWDRISTEVQLGREIYGIYVKGIIDLYCRYEEKIFIYDWKTNSTCTHKMHREQRLFYSWLIWKIRNVIPQCKWLYLRQDKSQEDEFTYDELNDFDNEIYEFTKKIQEMGTDIDNYGAGDWTNPFNVYYDLCQAEVERRNDKSELSITMNIRGSHIFFDDNIPPKLLDGIDFATKFDLPDKYHRQKAAKKKGGYINLADVGTVHLCKNNYFPIGLLDKVMGICHDYGKYYNKDVKIFLVDNRDGNIMDKQIVLRKKLMTDKVLRPYQVEAVETFMKKKEGIVNIATGGGKTLVATEIIRRVRGQTLWIIDKKELLNQTKEVLEDLLGIHVGVISDGKVDIKDVTIATIQSLNNPKLKDYLYNVNFVVVDEYHKSAAESYQTLFVKLPNTKYRLGMCLDEKSKINIKNGKKLLKILKIGDKVSSFNFNKKTVEYKKIKNIWKTNKTKYIIKINTPRGLRKIFCSGEHKFFCGGVWKKAKDLNNCETVLFIGDDKCQ